MKKDKNYNNPFKVGDKIQPTHSSEYYTSGQRYEVQGVDGDFVEIFNDNEMLDRFNHRNFTSVKIMFE